MEQKSSPDDVWHYTDAAGLLGIVRDHAIWAGCTDFMNDEMETIKGFELLRSRWGEHGTESVSEQDGKKIETVLDRLRGSLRRQFIVSASENSDSLTLWRNYGKEAVSYAVCLSPDAMLVPVSISKYWDTEEWPHAPENYLEEYVEEYMDEDGRTHRALTYNPDTVYVQQREGWNKVEYDLSRQIGVVDRVAQEMLGIHETQETADPEVTVAELFRYDEWESELTLIKDEGFQHEEETRMHFHSVAPEWKFVHYRATPLGVTPYIVLTEPVAQKFRSNCMGHGGFEPRPQRLPIQAIRVGPTRYPELAERALRNLLNENGYKDVSILRSKVPFR